MRRSIQYLTITYQKNPITWFEIYVEDMFRVKAFYELVFNCSLKREKTDGSFEAQVGIGADDLDAALGWIFRDLVGLVFCRILLMLGGHPDVLDRLEK